MYKLFFTTLVCTILTCATSLNATLGCTILVYTILVCTTSFVQHLSYKKNVPIIILFKKVFVQFWFVQDLCYMTLWDNNGCYNNVDFFLLCNEVFSISLLDVLPNQKIEVQTNLLKLIFEKQHCFTKKEYLNCWWYQWYNLLLLLQSFRKD